MKTNRFKKAYRTNASSLHQTVGNILQTSPLFKGHKLFQEYPVSKINKDYKGSHWFDWVVLDLKIVIECHGNQHLRPTRFGGVSQETAQENFVNQKYRDTTKMEAAIKAGYTYIAIYEKDKKKLTDEYLWNLYSSCVNTDPVSVTTKEDSPYKTIQKGKAKSYRHQRYLEQKEFIKELKNKQCQD